jgi:hypothetical protein
MTVYGALPYPGDTVERPPVFSLYDDGHVIYTEDQTTADDGQMLLWHAQLTSPQADELVAFALSDGGLADAKPTYDLPGVYDRDSTVFDIDSGGLDKSVSVWALGQDAYATVVPDAGDRSALGKLASRLEKFGDAVRAGQYQALGRWDPLGYRITLIEPWTQMVTDADWPWPDLRADDFKPDANGDLVLFGTAEQGRRVLDLAIYEDLVVRAPDGGTYVVNILPLVPDPEVE